MYSVEIHTPNINLKELLKVEVQINGESHLSTEIKTVLDACINYPGNREARVCNTSNVRAGLCLITS